jgi:hypothetical protein
MIDLLKDKFSKADFTQIPGNCVKVLNEETDNIVDIEDVIKSEKCERLVLA